MGEKPIENGQLDIMVPFWTGQTVVLAPSISVVHVQDAGNDWGLGATLRLYGKINKLTPYGGFRFGALINKPKNADAIQDYLFGVLYGGEYFFHPQFSIGIEAQVNAIFSHESSMRFGNPGKTNINTASVIVANIYF